MKYPCPCCGHIVFDEPAGSYEVCPICYWEDDLSQLRFPETDGGANIPSLIEGQKNFQKYGASALGLKQYVRPPTQNEQVEDGWRPIDLNTDDIEKPVEGIDYGKTYPDDHAALYYWRTTYWRRKAT